MQFAQLVQALENESGKKYDYWSSSTELNIEGVASLQEAPNHTISYLEGLKYLRYLDQTSAVALIVPQDEQIQSQVQARGIAWLATDQPRLVFAQAIALFYQPFRLSPGIDPTATIDPSATLGDAVCVGAHVTIQAGVKIGNGVCIHPNVVIYPQAVIGDRATLHANCVIHERSWLGADCMIHSGAVIGAEGFGFVPTAHGWFKMEQSGCVVLEAGVEVGCNSAIDRPAVGETRIGQNTKLDNLVHIGHGCRIGKNCALAAQVGLAGGVELGDNVILAGQVGIANQVKLGDGAIASSKSGIHNDVEAGAVVSGYPAISNRLWLKAVSVYNRLPEMYKTVKHLKQEFEHRK